MSFKHIGEPCEIKLSRRFISVLCVTLSTLRVRALLSVFSFLTVRLGGLRGCVKISDGRVM